MNNDLEFRIEIEYEQDGEGYHAYCPALKGLHASGDTKEEAVDNACELARLYISSLIKHKEPIPIGIKMEKSGTKDSNIEHKGKSGCVSRELLVGSVA